MSRGLKRIDDVEQASEGILDLVAKARATEAEGAKPKEGLSAVKVHQKRQQFDRFMVGLGCGDLEVLKDDAEYDAAGDPKFPGPLLSVWALDRCITTTNKPGSVKSCLNAVLRSLSMGGWAVAHLEGEAPARVVLNALIDTHATTSDGGVRKARPVLFEHHEAILDALDAVQTNPILTGVSRKSTARAAETCGFPVGDGRCDQDRSSGKMRAMFYGDDGRTVVCDEHFQQVQQHRPLAVLTPLEAAVTRYWITICWTLGLRAFETAGKLKWGMIRLDDGEVAIPPKLFKRSGDAGELKYLPHRPGCTDDSCVDRCIYVETDRYLKALADAGVPTEPDDSVFPSVRSSSLRFADWSAAKFGDRSWIANPVPEWAVEYDDVEPDVAVGYALKLIAEEYARRWKKAIAAAGFDARHRFEFSGTHGMRRGFATQLSNNGVDVVRISKALNHTSAITTSGYIEQQPPATAHLLAGQLPPATHALTEPLTELPASCELTETHCQVEHPDIGPCGRRTPKMHTVVADGRSLILCGAHYKRYANARVTLDGTELVDYLHSEHFTRHCRSVAR